MPAKKSLTDEQIDALMLEFRSKRVRVVEFCAEKGLAVLTFKRWKKEWEENAYRKARDARLAQLPEKPRAWMAPSNLGGYETRDSPPSRDPVLALMVDLADNLGLHTDSAQLLTLCCGGVVVTGRLPISLTPFWGRGVLVNSR